MKKDIFTLLGGFLTALLFFFGTIGLRFDWFTTESINAFVLACSAFAMLVVNLLAIWRNADKDGLKEVAMKALGLKKK